MKPAENIYAKHARVFRQMGLFDTADVFESYAAYMESQGMHWPLRVESGGKMLQLVKIQPPLSAELKRRMGY